MTLLLTSDVFRHDDHSWGADHRAEVWRLLQLMNHAAREPGGFD